MVLLQMKDPLEPFIKRRGYLSSFRFLFLCDMTLAVKNNVKPILYIVTQLLSVSFWVKDNEVM